MAAEASAEASNLKTKSRRPPADPLRQIIRLGTHGIQISGHEGRAGGSVARRPRGAFRGAGGVFGGGGASGGGPRRWMRSRCKLRSTELICRKSGSASSSSGPIDRRGVSARASMEGDGDGDDGDSSSIDETRNLFTPRSRRASSVSLRERLPVAVEPVSLRSSSSASGRGGGYWRSILLSRATDLARAQRLSSTKTS